MNEIYLNSYVDPIQFGKLFDSAFCLSVSNVKAYYSETTSDIEMKL